MEVCQTDAHSFIHLAAEYISCFMASNQALWLRNFITNLRILDGVERPLKIFCDNKSAVEYLNNNRSTIEAKHIDIKFLVVKEKIQSGHISIEHIGTNSMIAGLLTKALTPKYSESSGSTPSEYSLLHEVVDLHPVEDVVETGSGYQDF
ncbi:hypothetical protein AgCh_006372 [Apium graveolens]